MDKDNISWKVIDKYFKDNPSNLVSHHLESYNDFFKYGIKRIFKENKISYDYITNLPLFSLTLEKIEEFNKDYNDKLSELTLYKNTTIEQLWINEIDNLEKVYIKWLSNFEESISSNDVKIKNKSKINKSRKTEIDVYEEKSEKVEKKTVKK